MNLEIKIVKSKDVFKLLEDKIFISKWSSLAKFQKSVTVHQEYPFVYTWYHQYKNRFSPVFVIGVDEKSEVVAILPLAQDLNNLKITHAGAWQAEYKGWICKKKYENTFPVQALIAIKEHFKLQNLEWGWLAPRLSTDWFSSDILHKENIFIKYDKQDSPVLDVCDEERIDQIKKKKATRNKINQIKRKGDFFIERITSKENALQIIDILAEQSDFRQMAIHNVAPFGDDINKASFLLDRLNFPENIHYTVLWSNNKPLAINFGECDTDTVYLGVTSYDPTASKNSPGQILIIKLAELIREEGFNYLDLTPGGDKYKERFGNLHQKIFHLDIYFNKKDYVNSKIKKIPKNTVKKIIEKIHVDPRTLATRIIMNPLKKLKKIFSGIYCDETYIYYKLTVKGINEFETDKNLSIKKNNYSDLLRYKGKEKTTLLSQALTNFSHEDTLYTITINKNIVHYGWLTKKINSKIFLKSNTIFNFPKNSIILYDFFTLPEYRGQGLYTKSLKKIINDCKALDVQDVFIGIAKGNTPSKSVIEKVGFKVYYKFSRKMILWKATERIIQIE